MSALSCGAKTLENYFGRRNLLSINVDGPQKLWPTFVLDGSGIMKHHLFIYWAAGITLTFLFVEMLGHFVYAHTLHSTLLTASPQNIPILEGALRIQYGWIVATLFVMLLQVGTLIATQRKNDA